MGTLVCWSGGCDSTLALHDVARAEGNTARAVSVVDSRIARNDEAKAARAKLLRRFKRVGIAIKHTVVEVSQAGDFNIETPGGLYQPTMWLSAAILFLGANDDLCFGYIKSDDFWHHRAAFEEAFRCCQLMRYGAGQLRFPLEWDSKAEVIQRLQDLKLYSACWWCEAYQTGRPCRWCSPCMTHRKALWEIEQNAKRPKPTLGEVVG